MHKRAYEHHVHRTTVPIGNNNNKRKHHRIRLTVMSIQSKPALHRERFVCMIHVKVYNIFHWECCSVHSVSTVSKSVGVFVIVFPIKFIEYNLQIEAGLATNCYDFSQPIFFYSVFCLTAGKSTYPTYCFVYIPSIRNEINIELVVTTQSYGTHKTLTTTKCSHKVCLVIHSFRIQLMRECTVCTGAVYVFYRFKCDTDACSTQT